MQQQDIVIIIFELVAMVLAISLHDMAQAWAANRLGDPTARMLGRITMNPVQHFNAFGMALSPLLSIFIFHSGLPYGWGKPVPMTYRNFAKKNGEMLAVCAGPAAQFGAAVVALIVLLAMKHASEGARDSLGLVTMLALRVPVTGAAMTDQPVLFPLLLLLFMTVMINLFLCVFNLLPMPFLDGGKILVHFLPYNAAKSFERNSTIFLIGFFLIGGYLVSLVFSPLLAIFTNLLIRL